MLIRKNNFPTMVDYHKTIRQTEYEQESIIKSRLSQETLDYRTFDVQDLVQKIKEQETQIQKLLIIIDKYKSTYLQNLGKIQQFQQYEDVIKDFLARKQKQQTQSQHKNIQKQKIQQILQPILKPNTLALQKAKKQCIIPSFSINILCQNQRINSQKQEKQILERFETPKKNHPLDIGHQRVRKDEQKQNKLYRTNYKQKAVKSSLNRGNKSFVKSNSTFDINQSIPLMDENEFRDDERMSLNQRVPSLSNMRRIQKCLKLLKS